MNVSNCFSSASLHILSFGCMVLSTIQNRGVFVVVVFFVFLLVCYKVVIIYLFSYPSDFNIMPRCDVLPYMVPTVEPDTDTDGVNQVWPPFVKQTFDWSSSMSPVSPRWMLCLCLLLFIVL